MGDLDNSGAISDDEIRVFLATPGVPTFLRNALTGDAIQDADTNQNAQLERYGKIFIYLFLFYRVNQSHWFEFMWQQSDKNKKKNGLVVSLSVNCCKMTMESYFICLYKRNSIGCYIKSKQPCCPVILIHICSLWYKARQRTKWCILHMWTNLLKEDGRL